MGNRTGYLTFPDFRGPQRRSFMTTGKYFLVYCSISCDLGWNIEDRISIHVVWWQQGKLLKGMEGRTEAGPDKASILK